MSRPTFQPCHPVAKAAAVAALGVGLAPLDKAVAAVEDAAHEGNDRFVQMQ